MKREPFYVIGFMIKKYTFRKFVNDIHLWLGLASGLLLFVVCLSGTIYTFSDEIQELLDPAKYKANHQPTDQIQSIDMLINKLQKRQGGQLAYVIIPHNDDRAFTISLRHHPKDRFGTAYHVNQFTGQLQGNDDTKAFAFFMWTMNLHRWLLMKEHGGIVIVGVATLIFVVLCISGVFLWVPRRLRAWKQSFTIKYRAKWERVNYDLHNTLGFYALPFLLIMALTGLCWSFEWYSDGVSKLIGAEVWGEYYAKPITSKPANGRQQVGVAKVITQTDAHFNYPGDVTIFCQKTVWELSPYRKHLQENLLWQRLTK